VFLLVALQLAILLAIQLARVYCDVNTKACVARGHDLCRRGGVRAEEAEVDFRREIQYCLSQLS